MKRKVSRQETAVNCRTRGSVSVQPISEFLNVCRIKLGMDVPTRHKLARELIAGCNVVALEPRLVEKAMEVEVQVQISYKCVNTEPLR